VCSTLRSIVLIGLLIGVTALVVSPISGAQAPVPAYVPGSSQKVCQVTGDLDEERQTPTINQTRTRFGVAGTDLGAPFEHKGRLYFLFGDTIGARMEPGVDSLAFSDDRNPEDCLALEFVTERPRLFLPLRVPGVSQGAYEVPTGGLSNGPVMYVFFKTDAVGGRPANRSILAASSDDGRTFRVVYDASRSKFLTTQPVTVNNADVPGLPDAEGTGVLLWGMGEFRASDPYLAYVPLAMIEDRRAWRFFTGLHSDSGLPQWSPEEADAAALFTQPCIGEGAGHWVPQLRKWLMLYDCAPTGAGQPKGVNVRMADAPWGPWSAADVIFDPRRDEGFCRFVHVSWEVQQCDNLGAENRRNDWGGIYGAYLIPRFTTGDDSGATLYYLLSTWNPYQVVLMRSRLSL
jgi:hypothetical protein